MTSSWVPGGDLAHRYTTHSRRDLRGVVRHALVLHAPTPRRVLDVGDGAGLEARALAVLGHEVTVLDPDPEMLLLADAALAREPAATHERVTLVRGAGERAVETVGAGWDVVCCHGVLPYMADSGPLLDQLVAAAAPGGIVSLLVKNAATLWRRPAAHGDWERARALLDADAETGGLGVVARGHRLDQLAADLAARGAPVIAWHGVPIATDHCGDTPAGDDAHAAIALERELGRRDPERQSARLLHLISRKTPKETP